MNKLIAGIGSLMLFSLIFCIPVGMWTQYNLNALAHIYNFNVPHIALAAFIIIAFFFSRVVFAINFIVWVCLYFHWF